MNLGGGGTCVPQDVRTAGCVPDDTTACITRVDHDVARRLFLGHTGRAPFVHYALAIGGAGQTAIGGRASSYGARQRGAFVHELGHQLLLGHHGPATAGSVFNYKPQHVSRMNYRYQDAMFAPGQLLFSTGDFRDDPIDLAALDECRPLGDRDLRWLASVPGVTRANPVCESAEAPMAMCFTSPPYRDWDWDGDDRIFGTRCFADGDCDCPPVRRDVAVTRILGASYAHTTGAASVPTGHAARRPPPLVPPYFPPARLEHQSASIGGPAMARLGTKLLLAWVNTHNLIEIAEGPVVDDMTCPAGDARCAPPWPTAFVLQDHLTGDWLWARSVALLTLSTGRILVVIRELSGLVSWGFLGVGFPQAPHYALYTMERKGTVTGAQNVSSVALAERRDTGEVIMLFTVDSFPSALVYEAVATGAGPFGWAIRPAYVTIGGARRPWASLGQVGLASWNETDPGGPLDFYAGYAEAVGASTYQRVRFVRRLGPGEWTDAVGCGPTDGSDTAESWVSLGVHRETGRMWAIWGQGGLSAPAPPGAGGPTVVMTRSATPASGGCSLGSTHVVVSDVSRGLGPAALLWDDRAESVGASSRDGLRVAVNIAAVCDRCGEGFFSDGVLYGREHPTGVECVTMDCLWKRGTDSEVPQSYLFFFPMYDPSDIRGVLEDFGETATAAAQLCRSVDGAADRCPPLPVVFDR